MIRFKQHVTQPEDATPYIDYIHAIAEFQFGSEIASCLFKSGLTFKIQRSVNTWRIRNVLLSDNSLFLVLRAQDNLFSLTLKAGEKIRECVPVPRLRVIIKEEVKDILKKQGNVFAKHVMEADTSLRAGDEAIVVTTKDELIAVGKMRLSGEEVTEYKKGVALTVRERSKT
ncbi:MAG: PUA domain-containing protein [Metallosphaera yellowstonensis]|jgi:uncharacterized protein with predicted RNA binding PUA domain|uniref:Prefoldin alpha subunit n=1 Tax=Metallosphaera yellowstonensis MK1 TaxID=671065 RepID=H2C6P8_9CREN|nr:PUA domain-containing protein [Metallosphaera yellowstonensis]EHP69475.1 prefoldin alpha subunit [Metallosphaera yellowstonensis MK1]